MKSNKAYYRNRIGTVLVLFLFFCSFPFPAKTFCFTDSLKKTLDLNDPRNPNCPCHKYQKLADEEYKKMAGKLIQKGSHKSSELEGKGFSTGLKLNKKHNKAFIKYKRKKRSKFFNKVRLIFGINHWDIWKRITHPAACYHWS